MSEDGSAVTEECFQRTPLDFVGTQTEIRYTDASKAAVKIPAVTTSVGTYPKGSMCARPLSLPDRSYPQQLCQAPARHSALDSHSSCLHTHNSRWRKNPVPMCNCDLGYDCFDFADPVEASADNKDMFKAYNKTNFHPGQTSSICPSGVQFPTAVDDALGATPYMPGGK